MRTPFGVNPLLILLIGFLLVLTGAVIPWLIVLKVLESTFFLNFAAYTATVLGLFMGIVGTAYLAVRRKK